MSMLWLLPSHEMSGSKSKVSNTRYSWCWLLWLVVTLDATDPVEDPDAVINESADPGT